MRIVELLTAAVALILIGAALWDAFETVILPRRVRRTLRLSRGVFKLTWSPWSWIARHMRGEAQRETFLSIYGPLALLVLLIVWAVLLVFGFGLLQWACGSALSTTDGHRGFGTDLYMSGTTFFTLGLGDVVPLSPLSRVLTVAEAGIGFGFLALVIGYLPILYQSFSRREMNVSLLDAHAGSPPTAGSLLVRHSEGGNPTEALTAFLRDWEIWSADILESHLSYPTLAFFRSQHDNQSWVSSLTVILDACALVMVGLDGIPAQQARLTFAIARHAAVDLSQVLGTHPIKDLPNRLPPEELARLRSALAAANIPLRDGKEMDAKLVKLRHMYEPYVSALAELLYTPLPAWLPAKDAQDDWQASPWE
ncbi:MAG: potassium channel family protein [Ktedonobacterales bacterium]